MKLSESLSGLGRPVAYYPKIALWLGGDIACAVFLCQFAYWRSKVGDREIYKSRDEIMQETGIGHESQKRVTNKLKRLGYISVVKKGLPARNFYKMHWRKIDKDFSDYTTQPPTSAVESPELDSVNQPDQTACITPTTSETTTEITTETTISADKPAATNPPSQPAARLKDELAHEYESAFCSITPCQAWGSIPMERKHLVSIAKKTRLLSQVTGLDEKELAQKILKSFADLKVYGKGDYWKNSPFVPSALITRWNGVVEAMSSAVESHVENDPELFG